ncbi:hypothetical protein GGH91_006186, partial [Coemansia sp. RSA 2671]
MTESELPEECLRDYNPVEEQWPNKIEEASVDLDDSIAKKRSERQERELGDNKLRRK